MDAETTEAQARSDSQLANELQVAYSQRHTAIQQRDRFKKTVDEQREQLVVLQGTSEALARAYGEIEDLKERLVGAEQRSESFRERYKAAFKQWEACSQDREEARACWDREREQVRQFKAQLQDALETVHRLVRSEQDAQGAKKQAIGELKGTIRTFVRWFQDNDARSSDFGRLGIVIRAEEMLEREW